MAEFVNDTFTDTNGVALPSHTGETGATWTYHPIYTSGAWIQNNELRNTSSNNTFLAYASGLPAGADYDAQVNLRKSGTSSTAYTGVMARLDTSIQDGYHWRWVESGFKWQMVEFDSVNGNTVIGEYAEGATLANGTYTLLLECYDAAKTGKVDGVTKVTNSTYNNITAAGRYGLRNYTNFLSYWELDNAVATDAAAGETAALSSGSFTLTPAAIGTLYNQKSELSSGSLALTGSSINTSLSLLSQLSSGSFSHAGSAIETSYNRKISIDTGSFALSGSAISTIYTLKISIESGTLSLTGSNISTFFNRLLNISTGSFVLSGSSITTSYELASFLANILSGTFNITGSDIEFTDNHIITIDVNEVNELIPLSLEPENQNQVLEEIVIALKSTISDLARNLEIAEVKIANLIIANQFTGALVYNTVSTNILDTTPTTLDWDIESYDEALIHDISTNPSRLTVPAGVDKIQITAKISWTPQIGGTRLMSVYKNGSASYAGYASSVLEAVITGPASTIHFVTSPVLDVVEGDYFEMLVYQNSGVNVYVSGGATGSWFAMHAPTKL